MMLTNCVTCRMQLRISSESRKSPTSDSARTDRPIPCTPFFGGQGRGGALRGGGGEVLTASKPCIFQILKTLKQSVQNICEQVHACMQVYDYMLLAYGLLGTFSFAV